MAARTRRCTRVDAYSHAHTSKSAIMLPASSLLVPCTAGMTIHDLARGDKLREARPPPPFFHARALTHRSNPSFPTLTATENNEHPLGCPPLPPTVASQPWRGLNLRRLLAIEVSTPPTPYLIALLCAVLRLASRTVCMDAPSVTPATPLARLHTARSRCPLAQRPTSAQTPHISKLDPVFSSSLFRSHPSQPATPPPSCSLQAPTASFYPRHACSTLRSSLSVDQPFLPSALASPRSSKMLSNHRPFGRTR
eukprot:6174954-Pleurochrysis_carterae.AAC.3